MTPLTSAIGDWRQSLFPSLDMCKAVSGKLKRRKFVKYEDVWSTFDGWHQIDVWLLDVEGGRRKIACLYKDTNGRVTLKELVGRCRELSYPFREEANGDKIQERLQEICSDARGKKP